MPTKLPRVYLTLAENDLVKLDALASLWGINRPAALRKAMRMVAALKLPAISSATREARSPVATAP